MKILIILIPVLFVSVWIITSCDKLETPYATVKSEYDTANKPFVLLEEYTGHTCINCPLATKKANKLVDYYRGKLILMSIHATSLADPDAKYKLDLRTTDGTLWCTQFAIGAVPRATVNRAFIDGKYAVDQDKWASTVESQLAKPVMTGMNISASYSVSSGEITANVSAWFKRSLASGANVCLYIVEDSIVGLQANKDTAAGTTPDIDPYYFNETFRASMNGPYGELLTSTVDTTKVYSYTKTFTVTNTSWDLKQLSLIATITDPTANPKGEIIGVRKVKIGTSAR